MFCAKLTIAELETILSLYMSAQCLLNQSITAGVLFKNNLECSIVKGKPPMIHWVKTGASLTVDYLVLQKLCTAYKAVQDKN